MIQIQQYGLQWTVKEKPSQFDDRYVFLKQGSGLVFCGRLDINLLCEKYPFLCVHRDTYKQLPETWTVNNLYSMNKEFYESCKKRREYLWHNIAEARAQHKPVKIPVVYNNYSLIQTYSERTTPYGINFPTILMDEENQRRIDEINQKYAKDSQRDNS